MLNREDVDGVISIEWSFAMQNFDEVLVPADHVSRNPNDTYYIDTETVLRCHTSAHQAETLRKGERAFLVTGVPLFSNNQVLAIGSMKGVLLFTSTPSQSCSSRKVIYYHPY